jgi:hypothetical protein
MILSFFLSILKINKLVFDIQFFSIPVEYSDHYFLSTLRNKILIYSIEIRFIEIFRN